MPPNPWRLLKLDELTAAQKRDLRRKLTQRQQKLKQAVDAIENALKTLSRSLSQSGASRTTRKRKTRR
jgi:uncharacterized protein YukE